MINKMTVDELIKRDSYFLASLLTGKYRDMVAEDGSCDFAAFCFIYPNVLESHLEALYMGLGKYEEAVQYKLNLLSCTTEEERSNARVTYAASCLDW